jgi:hypothetical protein
MADAGAGLSSTAAQVHGISESSGALLYTDGAGLSSTAARVEGVGAIASTWGAGLSSTAARAEAVGGLRAAEGAGLSSTAAKVTAGGGAELAQHAENPKRYMLRIKEIRIGAGGVLEYDLVREDISIYDNVIESTHLSTDVVGGSPSTPPHSDTAASHVPGSTRGTLLDIPALVSIDGSPGFYAALSGSSAGWRGAILYEKVGSEYKDDASSGDRSAIGVTKTKLYSGAVTTFDGGGRTFVVDEINTVDVTLSEDISELVSVSDADMQAGLNACAIGASGRWEILTFATAEQLAPKKYRLSRFLRGLKGTEWAIGSHTSADAFVLLDKSLVRITDAASVLNVERTFRAVSIGGEFDDARDQKFSNTGVSSKPLAPVYLRGEQDSEDNKILRWWRRSRIDGLAGRDGTEDPDLGESSERYEIEILNAGGTAVLRTLSSTSESAVYSRAQQIDDFGSVPGSLKIRVYQISSVVGRGYVGAATISVFDAPTEVPTDPFGGPYDIGCTLMGKPEASGVILRYPFPRAVTFTAGLPLSRGVVGVAGTADTTLSLKKNGSEFATLVFSAAALTAIFAAADDVTFQAGDVLTVVAPASPDATLSDIGFGLAGIRS